MRGGCEAELRGWAFQSGALERETTAASSFRPGLVFGAENVRQINAEERTDDRPDGAASVELPPSDYPSRIVLDLRALAVRVDHKKGSGWPTQAGSDKRAGYRSGDF